MKREGVIELVGGQIMVAKDRNVVVFLVNRVAFTPKIKDFLIGCRKGRISISRMA